MENPCESQIASTESLQTCAGSIIEDYLGSPPPEAQVAFEVDCYPDWGQRPSLVSRRPIACRFVDGGLTISLCAKDLIGLPSEVLAGWLDLELTLALLKNERENYRFNFSRDIHPLFRLTGSGVGYLRDMIEYIRVSLLAKIGAGLIIDKGRGGTLTRYCFHRLGLRQEDAEDYNMVLRHGWQRAFFLLRKLEELLPLLELEHRGYLSGARDIFWESHKYIHDKDRALIEEWCGIAFDDSINTFAARMTILFVSLRDGLLTRPDPRAERASTKPLN